MQPYDVGQLLRPLAKQGIFAIPFHYYNKDKDGDLLVVIDISTYVVAATGRMLKKDRDYIQDDCPFRCQLNFSWMTSSSQILCPLCGNYTNVDTLKCNRYRCVVRISKDIVEQEPWEPPSYLNLPPKDIVSQICQALKA